MLQCRRGACTQKILLADVGVHGTWQEMKIKLTWTVSCHKYFKPTVFGVGEHGIHVTLHVVFNARRVLRYTFSTSSRARWCRIKNTEIGVIWRRLKCACFSCLRSFTHERPKFDDIAGKICCSVPASFNVPRVLVQISMYLPLPIIQPPEYSGMSPSRLFQHAQLVRITRSIRDRGIKQRGRLKRIEAIRLELSHKSVRSLPL